MSMRDATGLLDLAALTHEHFDPHVGSGFILYVEGQPYAMTLQEVTRSRHGPTPAGRQPFSLIFQGPTGDAAPQHIYRISHEVMGDMEIFLTPIGRGARDKDMDRSLPMLYQAVFS